LTDLSPEANIYELRSLSPAQRMERFQAWKLKMQAPGAESSKTTSWRLIDESMTPEQREQIPAARHGDTRTSVLWVKFRHRWHTEIVVARGYFDWEGGTWIGRLSSIEDGDSKGEVVAIAWAPIVDGERPWTGPTIRRNEKDPW
jgi:hypothetical protein